MESFLVYLLNGALAIALLKLGSDPLHATVVSAPGKTIGFLGKSGYGKSTLAASFVAAGFSVLTDDLLVLRPEKGRYLAYPGIPRIKLFAKTASSVWGERPRGVAVSHVTKKLIIPLKKGQSLEEAVPLDGLYVLASPESSARSKRVAIRPFTPHQAVLGLIKNTYVDWIEDPARLKSQLLDYERIGSQVPVKSLRYPRRIRSLESVRAAIFRDLEQRQNSTCESVAGSASSGTPKS
jgi:hypothetical protein